MSVPKNVTWEIDPHTKSKHEILRRYLGAWIGILGLKNHHIVYLDGFCGPGRYQNGDPGSPIIALLIALDHFKNNRIKRISFIFIDERSDRLLLLESEIHKLNPPPNFNIIIEHNQFENTLTNILDRIEADREILPPTFAFIDPFGFKGAPYSIIQRLLNNSKTEIFINIMVDSINRFLEHPDPKITQHIVDLFGTTKVLQIINKEGTRIEELIRLYHEQLLKIAKFVRFFKMSDNNNRTIYCLFFATNNRLGHLKMKESFWSVDPTSGFKFSDATNPNQLILFESDYSSELAELIMGEFADQKINAEKVRLFVEDHTPFTKSHMKKALVYMENNKSILVDPLKENGNKRMKNTFPDDVVITF